MKKMKKETWKSILQITRSYELHVVHVETKLFTKKTI